jgi:hypothetical protein
VRRDFGADFATPTREHALGGVHALVVEGDRLIAHASLVARRLLRRGRSLRTGCVEAVAVAPDRLPALVCDRREGDVWWPSAVNDHRAATGGVCRAPRPWNPDPWNRAASSSSTAAGLPIRPSSP